jgi:hypothetical protein
VLQIYGDVHDSVFINEEVKYGAVVEVSTLYELYLMYFVAELGFTISSYRSRRSLKLCMWKM